MSLTTAEIQKHVARITYKPGWTFEVYDGHWEGQHLVIRTEVADTYNPGITTILDVHTKIPPLEDEDQLEKFLAWRLGRLEMHEMREFLKRDGKIIFDPHAENADRDLV